MPPTYDPERFRALLVDDVQALTRMDTGNREMNVVCLATLERNSEPLQRFLRATWHRLAPTNSEETVLQHVSMELYEMARHERDAGVSMDEQLANGASDQ